MGQIHHTRWQTSQPRPRRPRTSHKSTPCFPGALGPKAARDPRLRRSGVPEPPLRSLHPAARPAGSATRLAPPGLPPAAALPPPALRLLLWPRGREKRARRFPRPPPPRPSRFRFRRRSGTSGVWASGAERAPRGHVGCVPQASMRCDHVESGVSGRAGAGGKTVLAFPRHASPGRKRLESQ